MFSLESCTYSVHKAEFGPRMAKPKDYERQDEEDMEPERQKVLGQALTQSILSSVCDKGE